MKREGWQQATVRINHRSSKLLRVAAASNCDDETAEHGKAPAKPTNASKATGKCRRSRCASCHHHPVSKARDKTKGAHKLHDGDVALNHRLVSWRVVDGGGGAGNSGIPADYKGTSASSLLAYLAGGSGSSWHDDDDEDGGSPETAPLVNDLYDIIVGRRAADIAMLGGQEADPARGTDDDIEVGDTDDAIEEQEEQDSDDVKEEDGDEAEEDMGFCMVGITIAVEFSDGEEDWIVVEEIV